MGLCTQTDYLSVSVSLFFKEGSLFSDLIRLALSDIPRLQPDTLKTCQVCPKRIL